MRLSLKVLSYFTKLLPTNQNIGLKTFPAVSNSHNFEVSNSKINFGQKNSKIDV
jgi:hypothetical protein